MAEQVSSLATQQEPYAADVYGVLYCMWMDPPELEFLSDRAEELLGLTAKELQQQLLAERLPLVGIDPAKFYHSIYESWQQHAAWDQEFGWLHPKSNRVLWIRAQDFPRVHDSGRKYFIGVLIDLTPLRTSYKRLKEANNLLQTHLENSPVTLIEWDAELRIRKWPPQAESLFGWAAEEVLGKNAFEFSFVVPEDLPHVTVACQSLMNGSERRNVIFNRNSRKNGSVIYCEWHNTVLMDPNGQVEAIISLVLDVTQQHAATEARRLEEERLNTMMQTAGLLGWTAVLPSWELTYFDSAEDFFPHLERFPSPDLPAILRPVHPEHRERVWAELQQAANRSTRFEIEFRGFCLRDDDPEHWYSLSGNFRTHPQHLRLVYGVTQDITERRLAARRRESLEQALAQARERETRGLIVTGIAHEFNNLNTIISGHLSIIARQDLPVAARAAMAEVQSATLRAIELCKQLSLSVGSTRFNPKPVELGQVLSTTIARLGSQLKSRCLFLKPAIEHWVLGEATLLEDLLKSLINQATSDESYLTSLIRFQVRQLNREAIIQEGWESSLSGAILIQMFDPRSGDVASQMTEHYRTPFAADTIRAMKFSSASVKTILELHHGSLRVRPAPGLPTLLVEILLPLHVATSAAHFEAPTASGTAAETPKKLALVADDEFNIRELVAQIVEELGYEVLVAADGQEAIMAFHDQQQNLSLVVTDIVMPQRSGVELFREIRLHRQDLPVLLMTGYSSEQVVTLSTDVKVQVITKPFRLEELQARLKELTASNSS